MKENNKEMNMKNLNSLKLNSIQGGGVRTCSIDPVTGDCIFKPSKTPRE